MRNFRDTYLKGTEEGRALINEYYSIAPGIVEKIDRRSDSATIYERIYAEISACINQIRTAHYDDAVTTYRSMVLKLAEI